MKKVHTLQKIFQLNEYIKISVEKDKEKNHHPLKHDMSKSSKRIIWLLNNEGPLNQRTISKLLMISPQAISEAVKKLENEELIIKDTCKIETIISLTEKGKKHSCDLRNVIKNHANQVLEGFTDDELDQFIYLINKLIQKGE